MNPRRIRAWAGRLLLSTGLALVVFAGIPGAAQASESQADDGAADSGAVVVQCDPTWG